MISSQAYAADSDSLLQNFHDTPTLREHGTQESIHDGNYLIAQAEEDAYDPFSDYSEFDEASDEEADIYFFKNGRFLAIDFVGGLKGFTDNLANAYQGGGTYGVHLIYFFDLRFAMQFGFQTGDYQFAFSDSAGHTQSGDVSFTFVQLDFKYYFNTDNITKGLADLNPFLLAGVSDVFRTYTLANSTTGTINNATGSAFGLDLGAGIEVPIMRKKAYLGLEGVFHYVTFPDSNSPVYIVSSNTYSTNTASGYQYDVMGIFGVNF